LFENTLKHV